MSNDLEGRRSSYQRIRKSLFFAVENSQPFSLVRIGDGESVILDHRYRASAELDHHLQLWFGQSSLSSQQIAWIRSRLLTACRRANVLGIPTLRQCSLHSRYANAYHSLAKAGLGRCRAVLADAAIHRFLHLSGDLVACLLRAPFLGLVTSRNVLAQAVETFKPRRLSWHAVPPEMPSAATSVTSHLSWFPDRFHELSRELKPPMRGSVYLVGAGLMGKLLCELIRARGGIALDLGGVFDG